MPDRIIIQCPGCSAKLAISDASKLGKKIKCSKCGEVFVAKAGGGAKGAKPTKPAPAKKPPKSDEEDFNFDDMDLEDNSEDFEDESADEETPVRKSKSSGKKPVAKGKSKGKGKGKGKSGNKLPLIIGGVAAVVVLAGVGVWLLMGSKDEAAPPAQQPVAAAPAAAPAAPPQDSPNDKILSLKWLPQDTELIIHLKIADVWQAPLLKGLLSGPQVTGVLQQMQEATGLAPTDVESLTIGIKNFQQLQGAGAMMALGGPPPTDAPGLAVVRSKKPVDITKIQQFIVQAVGSPGTKLADRNGKPYIEAQSPKPGGKTSGGWFADANTLLLGPTDELFAAMDRGETVTPRQEFRTVDASPHLLFVVAPGDINSIPWPPTINSKGERPVAADLIDALRLNMQAFGFGLTIGGGLGMQTSVTCRDSSGATSLKPHLEKLVSLIRTNFAAQKPSLPAFAADLVDTLVTNLTVTDHGQSVRVATSIPDSAQQKLEQLPAMLMGMAAMGGLPFGGNNRGGGPLGASQNANVRNSLKELALALHNHHDTYGQFPAAATFDPSGKPLLSWRVQVLPFVGQKALYDQFHLNEPWDSDHNKTLIEKMPAVFASPDDPQGAVQGQTRFVVPVGAGLAFEGTQGLKFRDFLDGTSLTLLVVEVGADAAVTWTQPDDLAVDLNEPRLKLEDSRNGGFWASFADGAVRHIPDSLPADGLKALFTRKAGDTPPQF